ncbi:molybdenum cofactor guanylyltransferase [Phenylobacterium koreense]|uniref:Molybdenum cofactor guanylyltransferase n=1 Tax=Phenylobacterium koreense TaxID=266125 RepID=A0ABV2ELQ6_9CAUL
MSGSFVTVVLAGGEGRRMGGAKPLRLLAGRTLLDRAVEIAQAQGGEAVAVSVRSPDQVGERGDLRLILDAPDCPGPLAGLQAALAFGLSRDVAGVLTLPCDAPGLTDDFGRVLREGLGANDEVAIAVSNGRLHPTCAFWRVSALPHLEAYRLGGGSSLKGLAGKAGMALVDWGATSPDPFSNLNTLDDLAAAERQGGGPAYREAPP